MILQTKATPNVFLFAGNTSIGRRTVLREFWDTAFPGKPELRNGPEFQLPQFADLADLYRALRQEIEPQFSISGFAADQEKFLELSVEKQAEEIGRCLEYFAKLGQSVTFVTGNGIYEDKGILKTWASVLFSRLEAVPSVKLAIVAHRLIHDNELRPHHNVVQFHVPSLKDDYTETLMLAAAPAFDTEPQLPAKEVIRAIGGHPGVAKATMRLIARKGVAVVNSDLRDIFNIQEAVLSDCLDFATLTALEKDVLSLLSWVPQLNGNLLKEVIQQRQQTAGKKAKETFADTVSNLIAACLVLPIGANYSISPALRSLFRQKHGYGDEGLRQIFNAILKNEWERSAANDELRAELLDAIVYMHALEGGSLPKEFKALLLPSTLQEVVRDTYDRSHVDESLLEKVINWGLPAQTIKMDETAREEILSYVVRAQTRLSDYAAAEKTLAFLEGRQYRSRFYLRSFFIRKSGGDLNEAVHLLKKALATRKYMQRVVADLALCYHHLGRTQELSEFLKEYGEFAEDNAVVVDLKVSFLIAQGLFNEAEALIARLKTLPRQGSRAESRLATIAMKRDHDYPKALRMLTDLLQSNKGDRNSIRRMRALAAAHAGNSELARRDADHFKQKAGGHDTACRIEASINRAQEKFDAAINDLDAIKKPRPQDHLLRASILDAKSRHIETPLALRDELGRKAAELRAQHRFADEFSMDI